MSLRVCHHTVDEESARARGRERQPASLVCMFLHNNLDLRSSEREGERNSCAVGSRSGPIVVDSMTEKTSRRVDFTSDDIFGLFL